MTHKRCRCKSIHTILCKSSGIHKTLAYTNVKHESRDPDPWYFGCWPRAKGDERRIDADATFGCRGTCSPASNIHSHGVGQDTHCCVYPLMFWVRPYLMKLPSMKIEVFGVLVGISIHSSASCAERCSNNSREAVATLKRSTNAYKLSGTSVLVVHGTRVWPLSRESGESCRDRERSRETRRFARLVNDCRSGLSCARSFSFS